MYYGNKAKVHIPNWWEIRKMCKGLERLKPAVSIIFGYDGCLDGIPRKSGGLRFSANEDGIDISPHYYGCDYDKMPPQEAARRLTWDRIRDRGYKPADQPDETLAHFDWEDVYGFSYDKSTDAGVSNVTTIQRVTATRVAVLGLFALAAPKTKKHYEYYDNGGVVTMTLHTTKMGDISLAQKCAEANGAGDLAKECRIFGKYVAKHAKAIPSQDQISHSVRL